MKKSWGLIPKILDGSKKIESRWSIRKISPYGKVKVGNRIFFKNSGEPVVARAQVSRVISFSELSPKKVRSILNRWGGKDGIAVNSLEETFEWAKNKKYCCLIFLKSPQKVEPFRINKDGFGSAVAWLVVGNIQKIKIHGVVVMPDSGSRVLQRCG